MESSACWVKNCWAAAPVDYCTTVPRLVWSRRLQLEGAVFPDVFRDKTLRILSSSLFTSAASYLLHRCSHENQQILLIALPLSLLCIHDWTFTFECRPGERDICKKKKKNTLDSDAPRQPEPALFFTPCNRIQSCHMGLANVFSGIITHWQLLSWCGTFTLTLICVYECYKCVCWQFHWWKQ